MSFKFKCIDKVGAMPFNLFRSSEMYLIEAEANCHLTPSKEAEARQLLKELIRDSERAPQYTCDKSGQALLDEISSTAASNYGAKDSAGLTSNGAKTPSYATPSKTEETT